jgi:signal transduction histidine kinase
LTSGVPVIVGDPVRLHRALSTLLFKVARTTAPGGELYVAVAPSGSTASITIRSTGCGIDLSLLQQGSDPSAQTGGIDTDLARARRCLERHGATVHVQAARPDGQFSIEIGFPRLVVNSDPAARVNAPGPGAAS